MYSQSGPQAEIYQLEVYRLSCPEAHNKVISESTRDNSASSTSLMPVGVQKWPEEERTLWGFAEIGNASACNWIKATSFV